MDKTYRSLSGRRFDLDQLSAEEQAFLGEVFALYRQRPAWEDFRRDWLALGRARLWKKKVAVGSAPYRICQDLAARLGIAEGKVAPPDYRDHLADLIEERFGSRYAFCKETGIDQGHLSRVLAGKKHFASNTLFEVLDALGVQIDLVQPQELFQRAADPFGPTALADELRTLEHRISLLRGLLAQGEGRAPSMPEGLADPVLVQVRRRLEAGEDRQQVANETLAKALEERAGLARELAATADQERAAHSRAG